MYFGVRRCSTPARLPRWGPRLTPRFFNKQIKAVTSHRTPNLSPAKAGSNSCGIVILGWRAEAALTPGYFISRLQREDRSSFLTRSESISAA